MAKSTKIIAALGVVAGLGVAAMPLASHAVTAQPSQVVDTVTMTVAEACGFSAAAADNTYAAGNGTWGTADNSTDADVIANTWTVSGQVTANQKKESGAHKITVICNTGSWSISGTSTALSGTGILGDHTIAYNTSADAGTEGYYVTFDNADQVTYGAGVDGTSHIFAGSGVIATPVAGKSKSSFTATYTVATGDSTPAGTYSGSVTYTLSAM